MTSPTESTSSDAPFRDRGLLVFWVMLSAMGLAYQGIFRAHPFESGRAQRIDGAEQFFFSPLANDSAFIILILTAWMAARRRAARRQAGVSRCAYAWSGDGLPRGARRACGGDLPDGAARHGPRPLQAPPASRPSRMSKISFPFPLTK